MKNIMFELLKKFPFFVTYLNKYRYVKWGVICTHWFKSCNIRGNFDIIFTNRKNFWFISATIIEIINKSSKIKIRLGIYPKNRNNLSSLIFELNLIFFIEEMSLVKYCLKNPIFRTIWTNQLYSNLILEVLFNFSQKF